MTKKSTLKSTLYKTGDECFKVHTYDEYHSLLYKWCLLYWDIKDIGELYFAYVTAVDLYDPTKGPFIAYLKLTARAHMSNYYLYNNGVVHVPLLKRKTWCEKNSYPTDGLVDIQVIDGDSICNEGDGGDTLLNRIADDNINLDYEDDITYTSVASHIPQILADLRAEERIHNNTKDLVYENFMGMLAGDETLTVASLADKNGMIRGTVHNALTKIRKKVAVRLKKQGFGDLF